MAFHEMETKQLELPWPWNQASLGAGAAVKGGSRGQAESAVLAVYPDQSVCSHEEVINQNSLFCHAGFALGEVWRWGCFLQGDLFPDFKKSDLVFLARYN